ncbi:hypothetical protein [uncultured Pseudacidovorax sp.]|uniref:hypothetical protein n=1 Tax=uncultured Pseudacidovorax sp. TaxID=679313 RepID=UPI0025FF4A59|nr:hypothetical protein [uncultured Pseudacidovorax sp.]
MTDEAGGRIEPTALPTFSNSFFRSGSAAARGEASHDLGAASGFNPAKRAEEELIHQPFHYLDKRFH